MGYPLLQNTSVTIVLGPFVSDTDFKTPQTALTINPTDVRISKNGSAFADATGSSTVHGENGFYRCTLAIANVDTLGTLDVHVDVTGALSVYDSFTVEVANQYNSKFTSSLQQVDVRQYIGANITETTPGNYSSNNSTFWDNGDALTTKIVNNVGTTVLTGPVDEFSNNSTIVSGTQGGTHTDTHALDGVQWTITAAGGTGINAELLYNIDSGNSGPMKSYEVYLQVSSGNNRFVTVSLYNYTTVQFDVFRTVGDTGGSSNLLVLGSLPPDYTDTNGDVRARFQGQNVNDGDFFGIDLASAIYEADTGSIPSASEIAYEVNQVLSTEHGDANWNGLDRLFGKIGTVTSPTQFIITNGSSFDDAYNGSFFIIQSTSNPNNLAGAYVADYVASSGLITISEAPPFTVVPGDEFRIISNPPVNIDAVKGRLLSETTQGNIANNISTFFDNNDILSSKTLEDIGTIVNNATSKATIQAALDELPVDTLTYKDLNYIALSIFAGKFESNTSTGDLTYFAQDNTTQTVSTNTSAVANITTRTRNSYTPPAP